MVFRVLLLLVLDRARDLLALVSSQPFSGQKRVRPLPDLPMDFREGWWGDLHPEDAAQLDGRWLSHPAVDALLLFEPLPVAPTFELVLRAAPSAFSGGESKQTAGGVFIVTGQTPGGPTWLLWHPGATIVVVGKLPSNSIPWVVRRFIDSARASL